MSRLETVSRHGFSCLGLGSPSTLASCLGSVSSFHVSSCLMSHDCVLTVSLSGIAKCLRPNSSSLQVCDQVCNRDSIMEFGFEPQSATRFEQVRATSTCRDSSNLFEPGRRPVRSWSKPNSITLYWSQTGPRLVADLLARASSLLAS